MRNANVLLAVAVLMLMAWLSVQFVSTSDSPRVEATVQTPAPSASDAEIERQIADLLMSAYQTGEAIEEAPRLWELIRQLEPDQSVILGQ